MGGNVTIVIPCKNEGDQVIEVIELLKEQYPIIIADSSDDLVTGPLLNKYAREKKHVRIVPGGLPAVARNNGARYARTPFILFLDADIYLKDETIIPKCLDTIINKKKDLVTIKLTTFETGYRWVYLLFNLVQRITSFGKPFALGGFMLFRTEAFRKLGGFNEADKVAEDYHLSMKIDPKNFTIVNKTGYTSARRFKKKGVFYMIKLAILCWLYGNRDEFFTNDHNYWK